MTPNSPSTGPHTQAVAAATSTTVDSATSPHVLVDEALLEHVMRTGSSVYAHGAQTIRQTSRAARRAAGKAAGRAHTASIEEKYGELERLGLVRIVRKKGRAPRVVFL